MVEDAGGQRVGAPPSRSHLDPDSAWWLETLTGTGPERDAAVRRLRDLLLRAARREVGRRRPSLPDLPWAELETVAQQSADDATVAVLDRLATYRGLSRFTTWAYKFAILTTAVTLRRMAWRDRELPVDPEDWAPLADRGASPGEILEGADLAAALRAAIRQRLTPHQREVLVAVALNAVPIDVLADRLGTTRGALYKTLHDARRSLRAALREGGFDVPLSRAVTR